MNFVAAVLVVLMACSHGPRGPIVTGASLYAHVAELRRDGAASVAAIDQTAVELRRRHYLATTDRTQVFLVEQVIEHCKGGDATAEVGCTIALLLDRQFTVHQEAPGWSVPKSEWKRSDRVKLILGSTALSAAFTVGAFECDSFRDCKPLMIGNAVLTGLVSVLTFVSFFTD